MTTKKPSERITELCKGNNWGAWCYAICAYLDEQHAAPLAPAPESWDQVEEDVKAKAASPSGRLACSRCGVEVPRSYAPGLCVGDYEDGGTSNEHDQAEGWEEVNGDSRPPAPTAGVADESAPPAKLPDVIHGARTVSGRSCQVAELGRPPSGGEGPVYWGNWGDWPSPCPPTAVVSREIDWRHWRTLQPHRETAGTTPSGEAPEHSTQPTDSGGRFSGRRKAAASFLTGFRVAVLAEPEREPNYAQSARLLLECISTMRGARTSARASPGFAKGCSFCGAMRGNCIACDKPIECGVCRGLTGHMHHECWDGGTTVEVPLGDPHKRVAEAIAKARAEGYKQGQLDQSCAMFPRLNEAAMGRAYAEGYEARKAEEALPDRQDCRAAFKSWPASEQRTFLDELTRICPSGA